MSSSPPRIPPSADMLPEVVGTRRYSGRCGFIYSAAVVRDLAGLLGLVSLAGRVVLPDALLDRRMFGLGWLVLWKAMRMGRGETKLGIPQFCEYIIPVLNY